MVNVAVIGDRGNTGITSIKILNRHPNAEIVYTKNRDGAKGYLLDADTAFLALPANKSLDYMVFLEHKKVIDMSQDHRCDDMWVYGLSEFNKDKIKDSRRIANPGCYATAILEAVLRMKDNLDNIRIKAYSGVSGKPDQKVVEDGGIERYAKGREHYQVKEIERCLGKQIVSFEPHLVYPLDTGIVAVIDAEIKGEPVFEESEFVRKVEFRPFEENMEYFERALETLKHTNYCNVSFDVRGNSIRIISSLDNLMKGGSGQAVQNFNIMYGFDEGEGLRKV
ncbi:hypothetical protein KY345_01215 [Candidatus Woesearchaeota archaeon]|nr:hypothetical protein [Candidatus Woesearchaeota archaeon]